MSNGCKIYRSTDVCYENNSIAIGIKGQVPSSRNNCTKYNSPHTDEILEFIPLRRKLGTRIYKR